MEKGFVCNTPETVHRPVVIKHLSFHKYLQITRFCRMYVDTYQNPEYYMGTGINLSKAPRAKIIINVAVIQITINNFI